MVKPNPGARIVPQPVAKTSAEAATDDFYRRQQTAKMWQRIENDRAAKRGGHPPESSGAGRISPPDQAAPPPAQSADTSWDDIADNLNRERGLSRPAHPYAAIRAALTPTRE